ncbi:MAG: M20 family metallopeptidase [Candidatus Bathyarchaeia archaeon]
MRDKTLRLINEEECVDLLRRWVNIPTENPPGNEKPLAEDICARLQGWGFNAELFEVLPNRPDAIAVLKGSEGKPRLIFNGHTDVVPAGSLSQWKISEPYKALVKNGRLYGRGSADQKSGLVAMTMATKAVKDAGVKLKGDVILTYAIGEEMGEPGTRALFTKKGLKADYGIVTEPTLTKEGLRVATAESGLVWFHIFVKGKSTHASTPWAGINAISKAMKVVQALEQYHQNIQNRTHPLIAPPRCVVTNIEAGIKENVIPDLCKITVDRRIIPTESTEQVIKEVTQTLEELKRDDPDFQYEVKYGPAYYPTEGTGVYDAAEISQKSRIFEIISSNQKEVTGYSAKPWGTPYSSDMRNLVHQGKVEAVTFGPGMVENVHQPDEYVAVDDLIKSTKIMALTILDLLA